MANEQNIIPHRFTSDQSREQAAKNGRKGGKASGKARRERRALSDAFETLLNLPEATGDLEQLEDVLTVADLDTATLTVQDRIALTVIRKAQSGDIKAFEIIRDTVGNRPSEQPSAVKDAAARIRAMVESRAAQYERRRELLETLDAMSGLPEAAQAAVSELLALESGGKGARR